MIRVCQTRVNRFSSSLHSHAERGNEVHVLSPLLPGKRHLNARFISYIGRLAEVDFAGEKFGEEIISNLC